MSEPIEGRVAAIVSVREIAINKGDRDGVTAGMIFAILAESPQQITDPETEDLLDEIDREKVRVRITEVRDRMAIGRTFTKYQTGGGILGSLTMPNFYAPSRTRFRTLRVEDSELPPPLPEEESFVKRGDRVRQVTRQFEEDLEVEDGPSPPVSPDG